MGEGLDAPVTDCEDVREIVADNVTDCEGVTEGVRVDDVEVDGDTDPGPLEDGLTLGEAPNESDGVGLGVGDTECE